MLCLLRTQMGDKKKAHGESETNPVSDREREPASSSPLPNEPAQTETKHTLCETIAF